MWNHCSPVFHFNWLYSVPRPPYSNLPLNYRYRQKTSCTYWTFALHQLTFSTTVNATNSCMEEQWGHLFLLLSQKLWCNMWNNMPLQLVDKWYRFGYTTLTTLLPPFTKMKLTVFMTTLTNRMPTSSLLKNQRKRKTSFSRLFGKPWQWWTANDSVQKLMRADRLLDESSYNPTPHKATTLKTLTRRGQLVCDTGQLTWWKQITWTCFAQE